MSLVADYVALKQIYKPDNVVWFHETMHPLPFSRNAKTAFDAPRIYKPIVCGSYFLQPRRLRAVHEQRSGRHVQHFSKRFVEYMDLLVRVEHPYWARTGDAHMLTKPRNETFLMPLCSTTTEMRLDLLRPWTWRVPPGVAGTTIPRRATARITRVMRTWRV